MKIFDPYYFVLFLLVSLLAFRQIQRSLRRSDQFGKRAAYFFAGIYLVVMLGLIVLGMLTDDLNKLNVILPVIVSFLIVFVPGLLGR